MGCGAVIPPQPPSPMPDMFPAARRCGRGGARRRFLEAFLKGMSSETPLPLAGAGGGSGVYAGDGRRRPDSHSAQGVCERGFLDFRPISSRLTVSIRDREPGGGWPQKCTEQEIAVTPVFENALL